MKVFNVHTITDEKLQALLNVHAAKGYEVRWFRNVPGSKSITVVFEMDAEAYAKRPKRGTAAAIERVEQAAAAVGT